MEAVPYSEITEDSKRWVFARPYNANAETRVLTLEENKAGFNGLLGRLRISEFGLSDALWFFNQCLADTPRKGIINIEKWRFERWN